jgi:hypothetical protein
VHSCAHPASTRGAFRPIVTRREAGCDGRKASFDVAMPARLSLWLQAGVADGKGVWSWRPWAGAKRAGDDPFVTVTMRSRTPGRARYKPYTIAQGRPADPVEPVVTNSCAFYTAHEAAGATSIRSSLRPLLFRGTPMPLPPGRERAAGRRRCVSRACHCERSEPIQNLSTAALWIASSLTLLAMTVSCLKIESEHDRGRWSDHLAPPAGRGRIASSDAIRVRGTHRGLGTWRLPLTPTLSPHAGRGSRESVTPPSQAPRRDASAAAAPRASEGAASCTRPRSCACSRSRTPRARQSRRPRARSSRSCR